MRHAHACEYSLWTRDPETVVAGAMREFGVGLVPYSPLGQGFLTGTVTVGALEAGDARSRFPASPPMPTRRSPTPSGRWPTPRA